MVKKFVKRIAGILLVGTTALGLGLTSAKAEVAADPFDFVFDVVSGDIYAYSRPQWKDNDSSAHIYYAKGNYPVAMCVIAYDGGYVEDIPMQYKIYYLGQSEDIYNWVKESGYHKAALKGEATVDHYYWASGCWFPDTRE